MISYNSQRYSYNVEQSDSCINTFTLGLVLADSPPAVAILAHVCTMLGAAAAGLGRTVRTLAHVDWKRKQEMSATRNDTAIF